MKFYVFFRFMFILNFIRSICFRFYVIMFCVILKYDSGMNIEMVCVFFDVF